MYTLGINAAFRDPAACLVRDGHVIAAAAEERFTRRTHCDGPDPVSACEPPFHAIDFCLRQAGITLAEVAHIAYAYDPALLAGQRRAEGGLLHERAVGAAPRGGPEQREALFLASVLDASRRLVAEAPQHLRARLGDASPGASFQWHFVAHHLAHAASAFLPSPFARAAILTLDGRGERASTVYALGEGDAIEPLAEVLLPHSLGMLSEQVAAHLGFPRTAGAAIVMDLAAFGRPRYLDAFRAIVRVEGEGRFTVAPPELSERLGPARAPGMPLEQRHFDVARSLQACVEETALELVAWLHEATGAERLCLAGEVALNTALNARLRDETSFKEVWAQPAAGDAGAALGAALLMDAQERGGRGAYRMEHAFLGPAYGEEEIEALLRLAHLPYRRVGDPAAAAAELLAQDKAVGWFQGRMEFGPRALGARAIFASPLRAGMRGRLNELTGREELLPVAPAVPEEEARAWFVGAEASPFMAFDFDVRPERAELIPAVSHVDGTARIQTVGREQHPHLHELLHAFARKTGVPVLACAPLQSPGEPVACSPRDALEVFQTTTLDALAIASFLVEKPQD